ncbi:MAG: hypothetical protein LBB48_00710 [Treponema sp.]|nr:hypothetical protein [Treponema sp.]
MKAFIASVPLFIVSVAAISAQNFPVAGNWKLQIIGMPEEFPVMINGTTWTFKVNGAETPQIVAIDNNERTVRIPLLSGLADYYFFEIKNGYVDLKVGGKFNMPVFDAMRGGMTELEGINDVTDAFIEKITAEIEAAFYKVPIMRLYQSAETAGMVGIDGMKGF